MEWNSSILLLANAILAVAWVWGLFTLSVYVKPGKGWAFALTPFWIFFPSWFKQEGRPYLIKARIFIGASIALYIGAILFYF